MYCITLRNKFEDTVVGWYDQSASHFSTDQRRAKVFRDREAATWWQINFDAGIRAWLNTLMSPLLSPRRSSIFSTATGRSLSDTGFLCETGHPCSRWGQPQEGETVSWDHKPSLRCWWAFPVR